MMASATMSRTTATAARIAEGPGPGGRSPAPARQAKTSGGAGRRWRPAPPVSSVRAVQPRAQTQPLAWSSGTRKYRRKPAEAIHSIQLISLALPWVTRMSV